MVHKTHLRHRSLLSYGRLFKAAPVRSLAQTFAKPSTSQDHSVSAHSSGSSSQDISSFYPTSAEAFSQPSEVFSQPYPLSFAGPLEADDIPLSETHESDPDFSGSFSDSEDNTESLDKPEQTEELNYRETVRSVHSFMGWDHIPTFESDFSEPDKTNNPWKGKNPKRPSRISVAMPPNDWLCQKLVCLNCTVAEGYPKKGRICKGTDISSSLVPDAFSQA